MSEAKKQHYHMGAILRKFERPVDIGGVKKNKLIIIDKHTGVEEYADHMDPRFYGIKVWNNEIESKDAKAIEDRFINQTRHIENKGNVCNHKVISDYHRLWCLRYLYVEEAQNPDTPRQIQVIPRTPARIFDVMRTDASRIYGAYVDDNGYIDLKEDTSYRFHKDYPANAGQYEQAKWDILYSPEGGFISADFYRRAIIPFSPHYVLCAVRPSKHTKEIDIVGEEKVRELNAIALQDCERFCFKEGK